MINVLKTRRKENPEARIFQRNMFLVFELFYNIKVALIVSLVV